jgi:hypothetical protein
LPELASRGLNEVDPPIWQWRPRHYMKTYMRAQRGMREAAIHEPVEIGPEVAERMALETAPDGLTVGCFVMTRGAQRAWEAVNNQLGETQGALFWIGGAGGTGKTHFLNYIIALSIRAGALAAEPARHLTLAVNISERTNAADLDRQLVELLAQELAGDQKTAALWRQMRGSQALAVALDRARRQGVRSVTAAIDFGIASIASAVPHMKALAETARSLKHPKLTVIAAGRDDAPEGARAFNIAAEENEEVTVAIGRARRLDDAAARLAADAYRGIDTGDYYAQQMFPFHPATVAVLHVIASGDGMVAQVAQVAREALNRWHEAKSLQRIIYPVELLQFETARRNIESRLGESGRAALKIAYVAVGAVSERQREIARQIVDTVMLHELTGETLPFALEEIGLRVPAVACDGGRRATPALGELVAQLAARSHGVIVFNPRERSVRFNPRAAGAPEVAAFNAAIQLARRFDSTLTPAQELPDLKAMLKRLAAAMASALEGAFRNRDTLAAALRESGTKLSSDQQKTFADFTTLAEGGPQALIDFGTDMERREAALKMVADYEALAVLAGAVPRLRAMREYLHATGLTAVIDDNPLRDRHLVALETECQLLMVAVNPAALSNASRSFDSLEARFQKFKWTYVQYYRAAHEQWRAEMERFAGIAEDAQRYLDALRRLNSIAALGPVEGAELAAQMAAISRRIVRCDLGGPLSPEITPCCPRCGFVMGTPSPREDLDDLLVRAKRGLQAKLAVLSQNAIGRLIQQHDHSHRLEGFLKITQAAQTEALVRVLDDKLTRYLARLLDENLAEARDGDGAGRGVVQALRPTRFKRQGSVQGDRQIRVPRSDDSGD